MTWVTNLFNKAVRECECGKRNADSYRDHTTGEIVHLCTDHAPQSHDDGLEFVEEPAPMEVGHG